MKSITIAISVIMAAAVWGQEPQSQEEIEIPQVDGEFWRCTVPPEIPPYPREKLWVQDFTVYQAADGTWQLISSVIPIADSKKLDPNIGILHRWEAKSITDTNWTAKGCVIRDKVTLFAPHCVKDNGKYYLLYTDKTHVYCMASDDGKNFIPQKNYKGDDIITTVNGIDIMLLRDNDQWHLYRKMKPCLAGHFTKADLQNCNEFGVCTAETLLGPWGKSRPVIIKSDRRWWGGGTKESPFVYKRKGAYYHWYQANVHYSLDPFDFRDHPVARTAIDREAGPNGEPGMGGVIAPEIVNDNGQYYLFGYYSRDPLKKTENGPALRGHMHWAVRLKWVNRSGKDVDVWWKAYDKRYARGTHPSGAAGGLYYDITPPKDVSNITMINIPGGSCVMGSPNEVRPEEKTDSYLAGGGWVGDHSWAAHLAGYTKFADEKPVRETHLDAFSMSSTEISIGQWIAVWQWAVKNGYQFDFDRRRVNYIKQLNPKDPAESYEYPAFGITWCEAVKWCNALSEMEDKTPCYRIDAEVYRSGEAEAPMADWNADGYRLPTEAEWEYACRAASTTAYSWGDDCDETQVRHGDKFYRANPDPVAKKTPNSFGLYDMHGNVWEWCWDYYAEAYDPAAGQNPHGPDSGLDLFPFRTLRGGSVTSTPYHLRSAARNWQRPEKDTRLVGFRIVRSTTHAKEQP